MYRFNDEERLEVLIVHPGGPFNVNKDVGAWSIPKGEFQLGENILQTALREFHEELGTRISGEFILLKAVRQKAGKIVHAYAVEGDLNTMTVVSNTFEIEWPPNSGQLKQFPEIDRALWCDLKQAREKINPAQIAFLDELEVRLKRESEH